jgi:hypothetical protein
MKAAHFPLNMSGKPHPCLLSVFFSLHMVARPQVHDTKGRLAVSCGFADRKLFKGRKAE